MPGEVTCGLPDEAVEKKGGAYRTAGGWRPRGPVTYIVMLICFSGDVNAHAADGREGRVAISVEMHLGTHVAQHGEVDLLKDSMWPVADGLVFGLLVQEANRAQMFKRIDRLFRRSHKRVNLIDMQAIRFLNRNDSDSNWLLLIIHKSRSNVMPPTRSGSLSIIDSSFE